MTFYRRTWQIVQKDRKDSVLGVFKMFGKAGKEGTRWRVLRDGMEKC